MMMKRPGQQKKLSEIVLLIIICTWAASILLDAAHHWIPGTHDYAAPPPGVNEVVMIIVGWLFATRRVRESDVGS